MWVTDYNDKNQLKLQYGPLVVDGYTSEDILTHSQKFRLKFPPKNVWVFHGLDRGDVCEITTSIYRDRVPHVLTSLHKEVEGVWDAWTRYSLNMPPGDINIAITANCTGRNEHHPKGKTRARPHWGVWFTWM